MRWQGKALHFVNRVLARGGVGLEPLSRDLDNHFLDPGSLARMCESLAERITLFLENDCIFPVKKPYVTSGDIREFYDQYSASPYRVAHGGSRFPNLLWLHVLRKAMAAEHVIDSGTFIGGSAWALSFGPDRPRVDSFDITLALLRRREANVTYHSQDWMSAELGGRLDDRTLCYFDDHIDQLKRVREAHSRGLRHAIFDDDVAATAVPDRVKADFALPKISFMFDDLLIDGEEIAWLHRGRRNRFRIDRPYLDETRKLIESHQRLPGLADITGIDHLPYRLVKLAPAPAAA
jgi:hypothetical protein